MKIALIGHGKMGQMIEQIARNRGHEIVSIIDVNNQEDFDSAAFASADVAIEFTAPHVAWGNIQRAWAAGVKVVSGSTGWIGEHQAEVEAACQAGKTLFWASNFSIGVAIFQHINKQLARVMNRFATYGVTMEETHHIHKLDSPSGTAITLAETIIAEVDRLNSWEEGVVTQPDGSRVGSTAVADDVLRIDAVRRGEVPGIHTIFYDSEVDSITLTHDAHSREGFALGAVVAAEFVAEKQGLLGMKDLMVFE